jgi:hypothetical protein
MLKTVLSAVIGTSLVTLGCGNIAQAASFTTVATGLNNPRGITFSPDGSLYVTEAGVGGSGPCIPGAMSLICYGETGTLSVLQNNGNLDPVLTNLPSLAPQNEDEVVTGNEATGLHDIGFDADGQLYVLFGLGSNPKNRSDLPNSAFGQLLKIGDNSSLNPIADLANFERQNNPDNGNPDQGGIESNPYAFSLNNDRAYIADAAGNDLLNVNLGNGNISLTSVFRDRPVPNPIPNGPPTLPMESVPTAVTQTAQGSLLVGELTGFPFPPNQANIYQIDSNKQPSVYAQGFTNIIDLDVDAQDNLYVLEYASNFLQGDFSGALVRVSPDGQKTRFLEDKLVRPTAFDIAENGDIYIANEGFIAGQGELVKFNPNVDVPEPSLILGLVAIAFGGTASGAIKSQKD